MAYPSAPSQNQDYNPPSYEEAQRNVFDAPPSYDSLYGQLREVDSPKGLAVFLRNACNAISNTREIFSFPKKKAAITITIKSNILDDYQMGRVL